MSALVETFWWVHRARARFDASRSFGAWIRRIATNAALDPLRNARRHVVSGVVDERMPAAPAGDADLRQTIMRAFAALLFHL
jgi:DNA-directed RNA polymerase specialized sigma24 family protein